MRTDSLSAGTPFDEIGAIRQSWQTAGAAADRGQISARVRSSSITMSRLLPKAGPGGCLAARYVSQRRREPGVLISPQFFFPM